ncbi:MAG: hypothetical protein D6806_10170 [Deltaproteobacteria bacterium]|nr:MAG: hypothetical protein D6806_10170 [Deltaproteobacteria bacterium]
MGGYLKKTQKLPAPAYVKKLGDCEKIDVSKLPEGIGGRGRGWCVVDVDIFIEHGYRYDIYRASKVYLRRGRVRHVEPGKLERAWKEGGMPEPDEEGLRQLVADTYREKLSCSPVEFEVKEKGKPRPHGDVYRLTVLVNLRLCDGEKTVRHDSFPLVLESEGIEWKLLGDYLLPPGASCPCASAPATGAN